MGRSAATAVPRSIAEARGRSRPQRYEPKRHAIDLCDDAVKRDPGPQYPTARGMTAAVFENFMMKIGYGS
eukprot:5136414-Prymnesium_polylepis.1